MLDYLPPLPLSLSPPGSLLWLVSMVLRCVRKPYTPCRAFCLTPSGQYKNTRPGRSPSSPNLRTSPPEEYYSQRYNTDDLIFPMSLPRSTSDALHVANPSRMNSPHRSRPSPTESHRSTPNSPPSSRRSHPSSALFSSGSASRTQNSMTNAGLEGVAQFQPQHRSTAPRPQRPPQLQLPLHINPQTGRVLTAADFSIRYPCQSSHSL